MKIFKNLLAFVLSASLALPAQAAYYPNNANGAAASNNSAPVTQSAVYSVNATFIRPSNTTQYVVGYMVANSTTPASVTTGNGGIMTFNMGLGGTLPVTILGGQVGYQTTGGAGVAPTAGSFRIHLFTLAPTVQTGSGDGSVFNTTMVNWCGSLDGNLLLEGSDWTMGPMYPTAGQGSFVTCTPGASGTIFGIVEARGVFTPTSAGVFSFTLTRQ